MHIFTLIQMKILTYFHIWFGQTTNAKWYGSFFRKLSLFLLVLWVFSLHTLHYFPITIMDNLMLKTFTIQFHLCEYYYLNLIYVETDGWAHPGLFMSCELVYLVLVLHSRNLRILTSTATFRFRVSSWILGYTIAPWSTQEKFHKWNKWQAQKRTLNESDFFNNRKENSFLFLSIIFYIDILGIKRLFLDTCLNVVFYLLIQLPTFILAERSCYFSFRWALIFVHFMKYSSIWLAKGIKQQKPIAMMKSFFAT